MTTLEVGSLRGAFGDRLLTGLGKAVHARLNEVAASANRLTSSIQWRMRKTEARPGLSFADRALAHHAPVEGREGYLFHQDNDALEQLQAITRFRASQLELWNTVLTQRAAWCADNGAIFRELIIPEKHVVYADMLPRSIRLSKRRPVLQMLESIDPAIASRVLYPVAELAAARSRQPTYFRTDTHWCSFGAYVGYKAVVESLASEMDVSAYPEDLIEYFDRTYTGDLGVRYAEEREESAQFLRSPAAPTVLYQNHNFGRGAVHVYEGARADLPRCVLFRDSFSNFLIPYLAQNFSRIVAVSSMSYFYDLLEEERPDVVLSVTIERFLATFGKGSTLELPEDLQPGRTFVGYCGTELDTLKSVASAPVAD